MCSTLRNIFTGIILGFNLVVISGCVPVIMGATVTRVAGGLLPSNNTVVIDQALVDPKLKELLASATKLTFLVTDLDTDGWYPNMAEYLEIHGDYTVMLEKQSGTSSPSQRKKVMHDLCGAEGKPHLVFSMSVADPDAGAGTVIKGVLTGRIQYDVNATATAIRCRTGWTTQYPVTGKFSQGTFNADQVELNRMIGQGYAKALMQLAGKISPEEPES